jgi:predicted dehydrogenase
MRYANGAMAFANGNQRTPFPLNDIVIHASKGRIDGRSITRPQTEGEMRVVTAAGERSARYQSMDVYDRTLRAFAEALIAGRDPSPSGQDGLHSARLTAAIRTSAKEGRTVELEPGGLGSSCCSSLHATLS